eukprot:Sspe_Gene.77522::Locus_48453_Transcript_1_1_Confidence_1.000_Length_1932::g.77522::m.77522
MPWARPSATARMPPTQVEAARPCLVSPQRAAGERKRALTPPTAPPCPPCGKRTFPVGGTATTPRQEGRGRQAHPAPCLEGGGAVLPGSAMPDPAPQGIRTNAANTSTLHLPHDVPQRETPVKQGRGKRVLHPKQRGSSVPARSETARGRSPSRQHPAAGRPSGSCTPRCKAHVATPQRDGRERERGRRHVEPPPARSCSPQGRRRVDTPQTPNVRREGKGQAFSPDAGPPPFPTDLHPHSQPTMFKDRAAVVQLLRHERHPTARGPEEEGSNWIDDIVPNIEVTAATVLPDKSTLHLRVPLRRRPHTVTELCDNIRGFLLNEHILLTRRKHGVNLLNRPPRARELAAEMDMGDVLIQDTEKMRWRAFKSVHQVVPGSQFFVCSKSSPATPSKIPPAVHSVQLRRRRDKWMAVDSEVAEREALCDVLDDAASPPVQAVPCFHKEGPLMADCLFAALCETTDEEGDGDAEEDFSRTVSRESVLTRWYYCHRRLQKNTADHEKLRKNTGLVVGASRYQTRAKFEGSMGEVVSLREEINEEIERMERKLTRLDRRVQSGRCPADEAAIRKASLTNYMQRLVIGRGEVDEALALLIGQHREIDIPSP